jgi:hypothetical protein
MYSLEAQPSAAARDVEILDSPFGAGLLTPPRTRPKVSRASGDVPSGDRPIGNLQSRISVRTGTRAGSPRCSIEQAVQARSPGLPDPPITPLALAQAHILNRNRPAQVDMDFHGQVENVENFFARRACAPGPPRAQRSRASPENA